MQVPNYYKTVQRGFWPSSKRHLLPSTQDSLPSTADRYLESVHFAELALSIPPEGKQAARINWYASAHMAAYIGIFDAAKYDVQKMHSHVRFEDTPLYKEMTASPQNEDFLYRDPINATKLYRALRNLRVHFAIPMIVLDKRELVSSEPHWYVRFSDPPTYRMLRRARLTDLDLRKYNEYLQKETIIDVFARMLAIIRENIDETAKFVAPSANVLPDSSLGN
jgi:hypothetical protein